jgi:hypothetical protein
LGIELPERPEGAAEGKRPGFGKGERPEGLGDRERPERPEGESGATLRRGAPRRVDNKSIEDMMLRTQGRGAE